ncbi:hypothetical protein LLE49_27040 [Alicyclobacillus tolerans]|uniref:WD40/YVTN/BNR-like repeat-containing protein n=1 Tax=Alicyclobacillus tolerans TaxID=90970 RepID=UPI001F20C78B|nr:hypothetical protein [Alicyclobacillus tolerans]MCF8568378.1 hypothetical protein [Alicyclobacillus tolerans]
MTDNGVAAHQADYHLFHTTNGGETWNLIAQSNANKSLGSVPGYGDAVFSFGPDGIGWMSGQGEIAGKGFLMRSADGGKSWSSVSVPVPKADASTLITTSKPVYSNGNVSIVVQYQGKNQNSTVVLQLNSQGQVVSTSTPLQTDTPVLTDFVTPSDGWATTAPWAPNNPQLYRTVNGGQSWQALSENKEMLGGNPDIHFVTPTVGFCFDLNQNTGQSTLWRTTNGGLTWQPTFMKIYAKGGPTPPGQNPPPPPPQFSPQEIDFVSDKIGYLSGNYGNGVTNVGRVYKTVDSGRHWTEIYHGGRGISAIDALGNVLWIDVIQSQISLVKGTLMFSKDGGRNFSNLGPQAIRSLDFVSPSDGWAVSESNSFNNTLLSTSDGGQTWKVQSLPPLESNGGKVNGSAAGGSSTSISFANPFSGILLQTGEPGAGQQPKSLLNTTNGGKSWSWISSVGMDGNAGPHQLSSGGYANGIDVVPKHPSEAYIWESRGPLLFTPDGGKSWESSKLTKPDLLEVSWVSMLNSNDGYALVHDMMPGHFGFILERTVDGMNSWTNVHQWP